MLSPFICGSFNHQREEDDRDSLSSNSPCSTPRKSRKTTNKDSKNSNPYSTRGLDKFSALLADLEEKRQKIYSQVGSEDISFVRFVYSNSNEVVPIVVKLKDRRKDQQSKISDKHETKEKPTSSTDSDLVKSPDRAVVNEKPIQLESDKKKERTRWSLKLHRWRRPCYYMPVFVILILLFLAFFGRSVAILCTSIGWYAVPTLSSKTPPSSSSKTPKKKQLVRRFSELNPPKNKNIHYDFKAKSPPGRQNSF